MDPVLQHLGDVTIQRLDKPKTKVEPQNESTDKEKDEEKADTSFKEEIQNLKRNLEDNQETSAKKFKIGQSEISITEKPKPTPSQPPPQLPILSDEDLSDYESESEFESESELDSEIAAIKRDAANLKESTLEDDAEFLNNLVDEPFIEKTPPVIIKSEIKTENEDTEDYEYDIKEKLKEMGEISFETVKKGDKP